MSGTRPIRLVATDLDGTLLHSDRSVTARTRAVLRAAQAAGIEVVFVTGRPLRWAVEVFEHVGDHGLAVISNGAVVWDVANDRVHLLRAIDRPTGLEVARLIRRAIPGSAFAVESVAGISLEESFVERYPLPPGSLRGNLEELFDTPAVKLLARHEELAPQEFWDSAVAAVGKLVEVTWSSSTSLLEISAPGVTKASTLALLCRDRGIQPAEVIAFGDMPNDLAMLSWAGVSCAMANAHPSVLELADRIAPSNDEDGVAVVLEELLGL